MLPKILWTICGVVILALAFFVFRGTDLVSADKLVNIRGISSNLPKPDGNALVKPPQKSSGSQDPQIYAKSMILMDIPSSYIMYAKEPDAKVPIASITKIATALVVLENHSDKLQDVVTITSKMISVEGSDIQLRSGEKISVENLLNGLLIMSGNDTAYALAEYFGGKDSFVQDMNKKVQEIGATNTKYQDPAGLDDTGYSTARELTIISAYALRNQKFTAIIKTPGMIITSIDGGISHELKSSNRMLRDEETYYYPYTFGVKTGFTNEAGHVLVSAAEKDGHKILSVVLNTTENSNVASAKESKKLLEWGFANWSW